MRGVAMNVIQYSFYQYLTDFAKVWLVFWGIMNYKPRKSKLVYIVTGIIQLISIFIAAFFYQKNSDVTVNILTFTVILIMGFLFYGNYFKNMAFSLLIYFLLLLLDAALLGICAVVGNMSGREFLQYSITRYIINYINIFTILIVVFLIKHRRKTIVQVHISKRIYILLFAGALTGIMIIASMMIKSNDGLYDRGKKLIFAGTIIAIFAYNIACIMMIYITESRDNYKRLSTISQNIIESQQQYYSLVNEKQQEIKSIRHEMKHHIYSIYSLYKANNLSEMEQYIKQLVDTTDMSEEILQTGNDIVNAILNDAQSRYKSENIIIRLEGGFPKELYVLPMDLCVIFANTVSNAVEAIQRMEREEGITYYIDIRIRHFMDDLYINIRNPVSKRADINIRNLRTSKQNKDLHGFGVKNVIQRVEKYHGAVNLIYENDEFFVEIEMKNKA